MSNRAANASNWNDSKPLAVLGRSCLMIAALGVLGDWTAPRSLAEDGTARPVTQIAAAARSSVVVVTHEGRGGEREGLGTGFVVSSDGLIATNYHVIGEARPIFVETADGRRHEVT